ncbi:MAG: glycosyltransferase [Candidatus Accumulibacter sp.]|nr:glycosyltransferase [Accumulibacter sp.]
MPLISVIIPCHNSAPWLKEAVDSIGRQSCRDLEILVYDDGSTDESPRILDELAARDRRIVPMGETTNRGIVHALNTLLLAAKGEYIARMDADDISLPDRFERQLLFLEQGTADLCGTWHQDFGHGLGNPVHRNYVDVEEVRTALLFQTAIPHPTLLAHRKVFESFQYRSGYDLAEDFDLFVRMSSRFRLANLPEVLYLYRRHRQQATRSRREAMESVASKVRVDALRLRGIEPDAEEQRLHNLIRAPHSIHSREDLQRIEYWLLKLFGHFDDPKAQRVIATQWTRAAVRAAPLGWAMWHIYRASRLCALQHHRLGNDIDLAFLAITRLDYDSPAFDVLSRLGLGG